MFIRTEPDRTMIAMQSDDAKQFADVLSALMDACATDDGRPALTYFELSEGDSGELTLAAADGFRLHIAVHREIELPKDMPSSYFRPADMKPLLVAMKQTTDFQAAELTIAKTETGAVLTWEREGSPTTDPQETIEIKSRVIHSYPRWSALVCKAGYDASETVLSNRFIMGALNLMQAADPETGYVRFASRKTSPNRFDVGSLQWAACAIIMPMFYDAKGDKWTDVNDAIPGTDDDLLPCAGLKADGTLCNRSGPADADRDADGLYRCWQHRQGNPDAADPDAEDADETDDDTITGKPCAVCNQVPPSPDLSLIHI